MEGCYGLPRFADKQIQLPKRLAINVENGSPNIQFDPFFYFIFSICYIPTDSHASKSKDGSYRNIVRRIHCNFTLLLKGLNTNDLKQEKKKIKTKPNVEF